MELRLSTIFIYFSRVSIASITARRRYKGPSLRSTEVSDRALHPIALAGGLDRVNRVVILCSRLQAFYSNAEHCIGMVLVQPDGRFRHLGKVCRIGTVVHDTEVLI